MPDTTRIPVPGSIAVPASVVCRPTKNRWLVVLLTRLTIAPAAMRRDLPPSKTAIGVVFSVFLWAYAIGQIPGGWLADRFGPRLVLLIIVPFWSLMTAMTAVAAGVTSLIVIRFVFGLAESGAFP